MYIENSNTALIEEFCYEFAKQCNYVLTKSLKSQLYNPVSKALAISRELEVEPKVYVAAHVYFSPLLKGYTKLTPNQLYTRDSKTYVEEYLKFDRHIDREFETQCRILAECLDNGWKERLALLNSTLDFLPWFRVLISTERDEEIIRVYSDVATNMLRNDKPLLNYLKTIKSDSGQGLDFSRLPRL
jgi:hypothetical protein